MQDILRAEQRVRNEYAAAVGTAMILEALKLLLLHSIYDKFGTIVPLNAVRYDSDNYAVIFNGEGTEEIPDTWIDHFIAGLTPDNLSSFPLNFVIVNRGKVIYRRD